EADEPAVRVERAAHHTSQPPRRPQHRRRDPLAEVLTPDLLLERRAGLELRPRRQRPDADAVTHRRSSSLTSSAIRRGRSLTTMCSSVACAPPPPTPSPSSVGTPSAAV